jgi:glycosyltransferase involved in cell wall biosynthesis
LCDKNGVNKFYASPQRLNIFGLWSAIHHVKPDVIYLNSYFSKLTRSVLFLRSIGFLRKTPVLVAPRGEFSPGALQLKSFKKKKYLALANMLKFHSGITWQVSSVHELEDAKAVVHTNATYFIKAPDIVDRSSIELKTERVKKTAGSAEFAFISRISPKKNLLGAINMLGQIKGDVTFAIYGPVEDESYWAKCEEAINALPKNIRCEIKGGIPSHKVLDNLAAHHFFLFPTLGENFGHVIPEALAAGCPVLLSDQTPWQDFAEQGVGWVIPLAEDKQWIEAIQQCVDMDTETFDKMSAQSKAYIAKLSKSTSDIDSNRDLFATTIVNQSKWIA